MTFTRYLPVAILVLLGVLWGAVTNLTKLVGQYPVSPLGYTSWTTLGAGVILMLATLARRRAVPLDRRSLIYYLASGMVGVAVPTTNMYFVLREIPVSVMSLVLATVPMFTYCFALLAGLERINLTRFFGIATGLSGAVILVLSSQRIEGVDNPWFVLLALLTPACYAANNVYAASYRPAGADSMVLAAGMLVAGGVVLFALALSSGVDYPLWARWDTPSLLIVLHALISSVTFALFFLLIKLAGPVYFSQVAYLVTLFGIGFGMLIFAERPGVWIWAALALIFAGLSMVNHHQQVKANPRR